MISTSILKNAKQTDTYFFEKAEYYANEGQYFDFTPQWWGKGAEKLGLNGEVSREQFALLLQGTLPNGQQLGRKKDGHIIHRPGFDITFSVPKSWSILHWQSKDPIFMKLTEQAVNITLALIEQECALANQIVDKQQKAVKTGNLVISKFYHRLSRENDMQDHVHAVVHNMTLREDGEWRSLASQDPKRKHHVNSEGFIERVRMRKKDYGAIFSMTLAHLAQEHGFKIKHSGEKNDPRWELAGVSEEVIEEFSQRSQQKEAYMQSNGLSGAKDASKAVLMTRSPKKKISIKEIESSICERISKFKIDFPTLVKWHKTKDKIESEKIIASSTNLKEILKDKNQETNEKNAQNSNGKDAIIYAISYLSEFHSSISRLNILKIAMQHHFAQISVNDGLKAIQNAIDDGVLIEVKGARRDPIYTTKELINFETGLISSLKTSFESKKKIASNARELNYYLRKYNKLSLNYEQKKVVVKIFRSNDAILGIDGRSGSGKTALLGPMFKIAEHCGLKPVVLTLSKNEAQDINEKFGIETMTVSRYLAISEREINLNKYKKTQPDSSRILFVDNSQRLSLKQTCKLNSLSNDLSFRIVYLYDSKQPEAFSVGSPLKTMVQYGLNVSHLSANHRHSLVHNKSAIESSLQNDYLIAIEKIGTNIHINADKGQLSTQICKDYIDIKYNNNEDALLLMQTKNEVKDINLRIHNLLKDQKKIESNKIHIDVLVPVIMRQAQYCLVNQYKIGQVIKFNKSYKSLKIEQHQYFTISNIYASSNVIELSSNSGDIITWDPNKLGGRREGCIEVFNIENREFCVGESIRCTKSFVNTPFYAGVFKQPFKSVTAGNEYYIFDIKSKYMILNNLNGKERIRVSLQSINLKHFDYAYAATPSQKYHKTPNIILAYHNSYKKLSNSKLFYKTIAQAKKSAHIYTENKDKYIERIEKHHTQKVSAIDVLLKKPHTTLEKFELDNDKEKRIENALAKIRNNIERKPLKIDALEKQTKRYWGKSSPIEATTSARSKTIARQVVRYAYHQLSAKENVFSHFDLRKKSSSYLYGNLSISHVENAINECINRKELLPCLLNAEPAYTTRSALKKELQILEMAKEKKSELSQIVSDPQKIATHLNSWSASFSKLTKGQIQAVSSILSSKDKYILINGLAGVGKTTMLAAAKPLIVSSGYKLITLAPTHSAVKQLKDRGLDAYTLDRYLLQLERTIKDKTFNFNEKVLLIPDESSMISMNKFHRMMKLLKNTEHRVHYIGDIKQLQSIEAGKIFTTLQQAGINLVQLNEIVRQKNNPYLLNKIHKLYAGKFREVLISLHKDGHIYDDKFREDRERLQDRKIERSYSELDNLRIKHIVDDQIKMPVHEREKCQMIAISNLDRVQINFEYRKRLIEEGSIIVEKGDEGKLIQEEFNILQTVNLTPIEKLIARNFKKDMIVRFNLNINIPTFNVKKGQYLIVKDYDSKLNIITLKDEFGISHPWDPKLTNSKGQNYFSVFENRARYLCPGDIIMWRDTNESLHRINMQEAKVLEVDQQDNTAVVCLANNTQQNLDLNNFTDQHWDYAYCKTLYVMQGDTALQTRILVTSDQEYLASQTALIVSLTRAISKTSFYIDNIDELIKQIEYQTGLKTSSLERLREIVRKNIPSQIRESSQESLSEKSHQLSEFSTDRLNIIDKTYKWDYRSILEMINKDVDTFARMILGEPKKKVGHNLFYGSKNGSLAVTTKGQYAGLWKDFDSGESGNLINLVQKEMQLNFKQSLDWCAKVIGAFPKKVIPLSSKGSLGKEDNIAFTKEDKLRINRARDIASQTQPIKGTLAEKYLKETRGINLNDYPEDLRYHPSLYSKLNKSSNPALIVIARNEKNEIQRIQAIYLDSKTAQKASLPIQKQTFGLAKNSVVCVSKGSNDNSIGIVTEGPEDALSVLQAYPEKAVYCVLGKSNFGNLPKLKGLSDLIFGLDNDGLKIAEMKNTLEAAKRMSNNVPNIWLAQPEIIKHDFNSMLMGIDEGVSMIRKSINGAINLNALLDSNFNSSYTFGAHNMTQGNVSLHLPKEEITQPPDKNSINLPKKLIPAAILKEDLEI